MTYFDKLKELVHSDKKCISVRDVVHQFNVHVSQARRILEDFLDEHKGDKKLRSVYVVSGTSKDSCDSYKSYKLAYAEADELEEIKKEFTTVDSCSLFSVAARDVETFVEGIDQPPILDISDISKYQELTYILNDDLKLREDRVEKMKLILGLQKNNEELEIKKTKKDSVTETLTLNEEIKLTGFYSKVIDTEKPDPEPELMEDPAGEEEDEEKKEKAKDNAKEPEASENVERTPSPQLSTLTVITEPIEEEPVQKVSKSKKRARVFDSDEEDEKTFTRKILADSPTNDEKPVKKPKKCSNPSQHMETKTVSEESIDEDDYTQVRLEKKIVPVQKDDDEENIDANKSTKVVSEKSVDKEKKAGGETEDEESKPRKLSEVVAAKKSSRYLEALKNAPPPRNLARFKGQYIRLDLSYALSQISRPHTSPQIPCSGSNFFNFKASLHKKMYEDKKKRWADEDNRKLKCSHKIYDETELVDLEEDLEISDTSDESALEDLDFEDLPTEGEESDVEEQDEQQEQEEQEERKEQDEQEELREPKLTPVAIVVEKIDESYTISDQEYDAELEDNLGDDDDKEKEEEENKKENEEDNEEGDNEEGDNEEEDNEEEDNEEEENEEEDNEEEYEGENHIEGKEDGEVENVKATDFIFNEADVSGSDSSDDEDPDDDIDELIDDEGAEKVDSEKARKEIQKIYHKELLNEDKRMLLQLQERYLEDGDLHSDQKRVKKFRWGTSNPVWLDNARYSDSSTDMSDDEDDDNDDNKPVFKLNISLPPTSTENNVQESTQKPQSPSATLNVQSFKKPSGLITSYLVRDKHLNSILSTKRRNPFTKDRMEFKRIKTGPQKCKTLFEIYSRN